MRRWYEDTVIVEEEMRRTIEFGFTEAGRWMQAASARTDVGDELRKGSLRMPMNRQIGKRGHASG